MTDQPTRPGVAVLLGTDHHPYHRLVEWAAALAAEDGRPWFVQHGFTPWPDDVPPNLTGRPMLGITELTALMEHADVVVTHGGPGLVMEARAAGHVPVVAPRNPALGEHVDGHQMDFAERLRAEETIQLVASLDEFREAVRRTREQGRPDTVGQTDGARSATVARFGELVEQARTQPRVTALRRLTSRLRR